ncbi:luciferase-like domain-containing protein [Sphaerosporella brunnea]|uniref:Luciferase-like domain-containing protein n=1 Tax=Sphaerosporella brunnea TaxID=1250544 RepID=A0A5J5F564_9PEZI|nr:luciferase-like domain-containing protein [Sphaerosporella brunnea]
MAAESKPQPKKWIMNAFAMAAPGHLAPGLWKHPQDQARNFDNLEYWLSLAKALEDGQFHGVFLADVLGLYDVYKGPQNKAPALAAAAQFPIFDPFLVISAMASVTKRLSFGITASTTYESPYALARKFSTLDHLTKGRVGWNVVTSYLESAAKSFGLDTQIPHDERYLIAEEFLEVFYKLLEGSWRDDAVVQDKETGQYTVPERVRNINHKGKHFSSVGPNTVHPSVQRTPFIFQAGSSGAGKNFATKHAEAMFLPGMTPEATKKIADSIREQAKVNGRDPSSLKLLAGILVIVDETDEKALQKYHDYLSYADFEGTAALFGGWTGHDLAKFDDDEDFKFSGPGAIQSMVSAWTATVPNSEDIKWTRRRVVQELAISGVCAKAIGGPKTVADQLQRWVDVAGVDGFNLSYAISPGSFEDMVKWLWPELKRRGVFWDGYEFETTRENYLADGKGPRLRSDHPGSRFTWNSDEELE